MKNKIICLFFLIAAATGQTGCNASFGRFFHNAPLAPKIPNPVISFSDVGTDAMTVGFEAAVDTADQPDALDYRIIYSMTDSVSSIADCKNLPQGVHSTAWQNYPAPKTIALSALIPSTAYYVNVIVKNTKGHFSLYRTGTQDTLTAVSPTVPVPTLTVSSITTSSAAVSFDPATGSGTLSYMIIYSTSNDVNSITDYTSLPAGAASINWQSYPSPFSISSLLVGTTYYINVLVKDENGAFAEYQTATFTTNATGFPTVPSHTLTPLTVSESEIHFKFDEATNNSGPSSELEYLVVYSTTDVLSSISQTEFTWLSSQGISYGSWQSYSQNATISGLTRGTTYYYNVIVRNSSGFALYSTASATPHDVTPPTAGTLAAAKDGATPTTKIDLTFGKGSDLVTTDDTKLTYKVIYAESVIDQLTKADSITAPYLLGNWIGYPTDGKIQVTSLSPNTTYYFNVIVKDEAGNMTLYTCANATTDPLPDTTPPTPGGSLTAVKGSTDLLASLTWNKAADTVSNPTALSYKVVASTSTITSSNFASMPVVSNDWEVDIAALPDIPVSDGVATNFMVAVKDEAGNIGYYDAAAYTPASLQSSLLCYYKLDNAKSDYTNKTTSSVTGSEVYSADSAIGGYSLDLSGNKTGTNYLEITPSTAIQNLAANFTISFWIKVNSFTNSYEQIISRGGVRGFKVQRYGTTNKLLFIITHDWNSTAQSRVVSSSEVADGKWHHVVCAYQPGGSTEDDRIFMYIDGSRQTSAFGLNNDDSWSNTSYSTVCFTSTSDKVQLGENTAHTAEKYTGLLDEVRIYSKVLSADEIKALGR